MGHVASKTTYIAIYLALLVLTATTAGAAFTNLGRLNAVVALLIAFIKAGLVAVFFMHLRDSIRLTWLMTAVGLLWLTILIVTTMADVVSRGLLGTPGS